jgi:integrase
MPKRAGGAARQRGLRVTTRSDREGLWIVGTPIRGGERIRRRAASDQRALAEEEAKTLEADILRTAWHGERRGVRTFAAAVTAYIGFAARAEGDKRRLNRILRIVGIKTLAAIDQAEVDRICRLLLGAAPNPATVRRGVIMPIRAVMNFAARRKWCDPPVFEVPKQPKGRTRYLLPGEAARLVDAAAPHLRPLLCFLLCTGARLSEALDLEWREVDLVGGRAIFWVTKGGERRDAKLNPRAIRELAALSHRDGKVFRWETKRPTGRAGAPPRRGGRAKRTGAYADRQRLGGGQIKTAFAGALRRAGLAGVTPHDLRHTWASWRYALDLDLLALKEEGGWSSTELVERYAHLLPAGHQLAIRAFWHLPGPETEQQRSTA